MTHLSVKPSTVQSADGTRIAVFESGNPDGPVLVAVHGYPDNHTVWDGVAAELADRYRVITYDVRGAGASGKPVAKAAYKMDRLAEDFRAVIDAVSPDAPVHLLAHDWGSIQSWGPVTDPSFADRIASFVSISGPSMDYAGAWFRDRSHLRASLSQILHSYYMAMFQIPRLPERLVGLEFVEKGISRVELAGRPDAATATPVARAYPDRANGINLYRANVFQKLARPRPERTTIPTLVLAPVDDAFSGVPVATGAPVPFVDDLTTLEIPGNHWVVTAKPGLIGDLVDSFIGKQGGQPAGTAGAKKRARR